MLTRLKAKSEGKLAKQICKVVLDHFEKQYSKEFGDAWDTIRTQIFIQDIHTVDDKYDRLPFYKRHGGNKTKKEYEAISASFNFVE